MALSPLQSLIAVAALAGSGFSQGSVLPSPLEPTGAEAGLDALRLGLARGELRALAAREEVTLAGVPLPDGTTVDLELARVRHERLKFGFTVDGAPRPDLLQGLDLSIWKGGVRGEPGSEVHLSFARTGAQGWIRRGTTLVHVLPRPDANGDWSRGDALMMSEDALGRAGLFFDGTCNALETPAAGAERRGPLTRPVAPTAGGGQQALGAGAGCGLRECRVAITSDYQYYQRFNDLAAQTAYTTTLLGFVSDRYETQVNTILTFPSVAFYTTAADPWTSQDSGGNCQAVLTELQAAWVGNVPAGANLGHLLSGANLGCGVAWLNVLCDPQYNFSVSGNMNGTISFPIVQQPNNWDFIVVAHEIGHNFNALHTHSYCPPLDECPSSQYYGPCQTQQVCSNQGTIMSYCHLCAGGTANITTFFHTQSALDMTAAAAACLPLFSGISGTAPVLAAPNTPTPVAAQIAGTPVGPVQVLWRPHAAAAFTAISLAGAGGGIHTGSLPGFACGETPQFYYTFTETTCGTLTDPPGAPASLYALDVGVLAPFLVDTFESDQGWTAANLGATSGDWQRGVPVNDAGWAYDPASDADGSGQCWLTQNQAGNTDVDGGAVELLSPAYDLTSPTATIEYDYYLRLTNSNGADRLLVEISANGTGGPWFELARHDQDRGSVWTHVTLSAADIAASGVTPSANMRLRFTANDADPQSIVEAGLDGLRLSQRSCSVVGANYCVATTNSSGGAASISATGSASIAANDLVLRAAPVPASTLGIFYFGPGETQTAFGNGWRCVSGTLRRFSVTSASAGVLTRAVNNALRPAAGAVVAGSTWNFQAWFRDAAAGGAAFNLSDGLRIPFVP